MTRYKHLSLDEREKLFIMKKDGLSFSDIGKAIGRNASSLSREYKRNTRIKLGYLPDSADKLAKGRKANHGKKVDRFPELKDLILTRMRDDRYSPEMISGTLKNSGSKITISTESIYKYIYSESGRKQELYRYLMRCRPKRNQKYGRRTQSNYGIPGRVSISQRPIINPDDFGHFEVDLTFFKNSSKINLLTITERKTGYFMADLNQSKHSKQIAIKLLNNVIKFPKKKRRTITLDNGKEFVMHNFIKEVTDTPTYFCHPGSPWEKPHVEFAHCLLHRFIPKKTDAKTLTQEQVQNAVIKLNNLPRKRLGFKTPAQMLDVELISKFDALRP